MIGWEFRFCVFTERTPEGFLRLTADPYGDAQGGGTPLESASPFGFLSRPRDPDVDGDGAPLAAGAAGLLVLEHGGHDYAIPTQDPRFAAKLPEVKKGGSMQYAITAEGKAAFSLFDGDHGTWQVYVPHGETASTIAIDTRDSAKASIQLQHGAGMGITLEAGGKHPVIIRNRTNTVAIVVNDDEVIVNSGVVRIQGGVVMGGEAAKPLVTAELIAWITGALLPKLAAAPGGPITVDPPPASALTANTKAA